MGESRLLWEIGENDIAVRTLRQRLGLDLGYVSRTLRSLERQGLVRVKADPGDGRVRRASLTRAGLRERAVLDRRSDQVALRMMEPLNEKQRTTLLDAMGKIERLLQASFVRLKVEDPASADARWCLERYFAELNERFEGGFDRTVVLSAEPHELRPPAGYFIIARVHDQLAGCGALKLHGGEPAELKRMWVNPVARGLGIGRRLLTELERHASEAGACAVRLETNRALREAIELYRRSGYAEITPFNREPHAHHWFEKRLAPGFEKRLAPGFEKRLAPPKGK
jgi:DNA-binding MarR family transcriptional regulator/ribosomal protein S18 acetylase RimI-like enzyme